jgi:hypothetical protein
MAVPVLLQARISLVGREATDGTDEFIVVVRDEEQPG